jgi:hypothetical protein
MLNLNNYYYKSSNDLNFQANNLYFLNIFDNDRHILHIDSICYFENIISFIRYFQ